MPLRGCVSLSVQAGCRRIVAALVRVCRIAKTLLLLVKSRKESRPFESWMQVTLQVTLFPKDLDALLVCLFRRKTRLRLLGLREFSQCRSAPGV